MNVNTLALQQATYICTAPPGKTVECMALLFKYHASVPYTQTWRHRAYPSCSCESSGVFTEVSHSKLKMVVNEE